MVSLSNLSGAVVAALTLVSAAPAVAQTIYDSTGGAENGGDSFTSAGPVLVDRVLAHAPANVLSSVVLNVMVSKPDTGSFDVVLANVNAANKPFHYQVLATVQDSALTTSFQLITVQIPSPPYLPNKYYYIGIRKHPGSASHVVFGNTVDPAVLARSTVIAGGYYYNNGGVQANAGGPYELQVNVTAVGAARKPR